ncbi:MAG: hypothetical protein Rubg2KO_13340 [Rubricoccaceae bacterium]
MTHAAFMPPTHPPIRLSFHLLRSPLAVLVATAVALGLYTLLGFAFRPDALTFDGLSGGEILKVVLVDQFLIECLTTCVVFGLMWAYARGLGLTDVEPTVPGVLRFNLAFLPLVALAFFVFNPLTQTARFLLRYGLDADWSLYGPSYGYSVSLYALYLALVAPMVYGVLNAQIALDALRQRRDGEEEPTSYFTRIVGADGGESVPVPVSEVLWFEVDDRKYYAVLADRRIRISETLKGLEEALDPARFVRINKSQIVGLAHVARFAPWVDGKYTLVMQGRPTVELTISRTRSQTFKARLTA